MDKEERQKRIAECNTLEELQALGEELGYKPGWIRHRFAAALRMPLPPQWAERIGA